MRSYTIVAGFAALAASAPLSVPVDSVAGVKVPSEVTNLLNEVDLPVNVKRALLDSVSGVKLPVDVSNALNNLDANVKRALLDSVKVADLPVNVNGLLNNAGVDVKRDVEGVKLPVNLANALNNLKVNTKRDIAGVNAPINVNELLNGLSVDVKRDLLDSVSVADLPINVADLLNGASVDVKRDIEGINAPINVNELLNNAGVATDIVDINTKRDLVNIDLPAVSAVTAPINVSNLLNGVSVDVKRSAVDPVVGATLQEVISLLSSTVSELEGDVVGLLKLENVEGLLSIVPNLHEAVSKLSALVGEPSVL